MKTGIIAVVAILMGLSGDLQSGAVAGQNGPTILFHSDPQPLKIGENKFEVMVKDGKTPVKNADVSLELLSPEPRQAHVVLRLKYYGDGIYRGAGAIGASGSWSVVVHVRRGDREIATRTLMISTQ